MTEFEEWLQIIRSIPLYLQVLVGVSILGVVASTTVGAIIAWQLSNVARAIRESAHRPTPPPQPPTNFGQPEYGPYPPRP